MDPETQKPIVWGAEAPAPAPDPTTENPQEVPMAPVTDATEAWQPAPASPTQSSSKRWGIAGLAVVAISAAALTAGGTVGALAAAGTFDQKTVTVVTGNQAQQVSAGSPQSGATQSSPVTAFSGLNDQVVSAAGKVSPAVVTIISSTSATGAQGGTGQVDPFGNNNGTGNNGQNGGQVDPFGNNNGTGNNGQNGGQVDPFGNNNGTGNNGQNGGQVDPFGNNNGTGNNGQNGSNGSNGSGQSQYGLPADQTPTGIGSGFIFDPNGWILTNHHVVADSTNLTVQLSDGRSFPAKVYGSDTLTDLAIVKIDASGLPTASLGESGQLRVGQLAIAVGDPLGEYPGTVTTGVVSGLGRSINDSNINLDDLIQTDAAINPGNSGGPLVDQNGSVIGIDTAIAGSAQGIGFAIPIDLAKPLMKQALAGEQLSRPWMGIRYQPVDAGVATRNNLSVNAGAWITSGGNGSAVEAGSPAEKAGIKEGDVITAVNGTKIDTNHPLIELLASHAPGESVTLTVQRGNQEANIQITLTTRTLNSNG